MSDLADLASDYSEQMLSTVINNRPCFDKLSQKECQVCGESIPEQRRKLGNVQNCIDCQTLIERKR